MPDFGIMRGFNEKLFGDKLVAGQLPTQLGLIGSVDFAFDPDAQAFFDRVTTAGGSLTTTEKDATNTLVIQMKTDGTWTPMKAIYPMVGASAAACAQNLKSSSFTGTFTSGWTFASTGVTPNGTSAYMDTNLNGNTSLNLNDSHASVYLRTNSDGLFCDLGNFNGTTGINIFSRFGNAQYIRINEEDANTISTTDSRGFRFGSRIISTTKNIYINNSRTDFAQNTIGKANLNIYIGARNFSGSANFFSNRENAFASIGDGLTNTQGSAFYTAVQAFQTTLSRNV
jgi:hypothetical protein